MPAYLERTTAQKVRDLLNALHAAPSPTASAREIETLLISRVRARRDDPAARQRLRELLADLLTLDSARLPAPACESLDPAALADELASLLAGRTTASFKAKPRPATIVLAAALLLGGAVTIASCGSDRHHDSSGCGDNTSAAHFNELVSDGTGLTSAEISDADSEYAALQGAERSCEIHQLCEMSPSEIAQHVLTGGVGSSVCGDDDSDDVQPHYKGVSF